MIRDRITIGKEEFTEKILAGERDLRRIILKQGGGSNFNTYDLYPVLLRYLKQQDLKSNPILLDDSVFAYTRAQGLYLPYVSARGTKFVHCKIGSSTFFGGDFTNAIFRYCRLEDVNFNEANLTDIEFTGIADSILAGHGLSFRGRLLHIENWSQHRFEARMQLGAYSQSGESRRMR